MTRIFICLISCKNIIYLPGMLISFVQLIKPNPFSLFGSQSLRAMVMNKMLLGVCMGFASLVLSCAEDPELKNSTSGSPKLDIGDASSLMALESSFDGGRMPDGGRIKEGESTNFYKVTTSGSVEEILFLNEDGTPIDPNRTKTSIRVYNIFDVSKSYLVLQGQFNAWDTLGNNQFYLALLVNKTNGLTYDFHDADMIGGPFFEDEQGNFYYRNINAKVIQVNVSDPDRIRKSEYLPGGQTAESLAGVDLNGNAFYVYYVTHNQFRIRKKNGGIFEFDMSEELPEGYQKYMNGMWMGLNGKMYLETGEGSPAGSRAKFHTVNVNDDGLVSIDTVWTGAWEPFNGGGDYVLGSGSYGMQRVNKEKSVLFVSLGYAWEFSEETNTLTEVSLPKVEWFDDFFYSQDYLYYRNGLTIYKISLDTYSYETLSLPTGDQWEIYSMSVGSNNALQVSALRFSDGKKILAEIDSAGMFSILDEDLNKEAIVLQRLN